VLGRAGGWEPGRSTSRAGAQTPRACGNLRPARGRRAGREGDRYAGQHRRRRTRVLC